MNLDYYHKVFKGNPDKMQQVREAIAKDFQENEHALAIAAEARNIIGMRKALHNMTPIAEALQYVDLNQTILAFKEVNFEPLVVQELIKKMHGELIVLYNFLSASE